MKDNSEFFNVKAIVEDKGSQDDQKDWAVHSAPFAENIKRNFKDSLFHWILQEKKYALQFWKEKHPESKAEEKDIKYRRSDSTFVAGVEGDIIYSVGEQYVMLLESQSNWNDNLAARCMFYALKTLENLLAKEGGYERLLLDDMMRFPYVEIYVVYCGEKPEKVPDVIKFSDAYLAKPKGTPQLDCIVNVLKSPDVEGLMKEYVDFCNMFRENLKRYKDMAIAARQTITECKKQGILSEFLSQHESEVFELVVSNATLIKANDQHYAKVYEEKMAQAQAQGHQKGREEGHAEGRQEERFLLIRTMVGNGVSPSEIARLTSLPIEEVEEVLKANTN